MLNPSIELAKISDPQSFTSAGTLITYSYTVINSGNVTLSVITVTDPMAGLSTITCPVTTLIPQAQVVCTATYTTTQADVDRGTISNTGTARGITPLGLPVTDTATYHIPSIQQPTIGLVKSANINTFSAPGTAVSYSYTVTNTGNVTLSTVNVTDPMPGLSAISCPQPTLVPAAFEICTATYTTTQTDVDNGHIINTGTASGTPPTGPPVTATDTLTIAASQAAAIGLDKSASPTTFSAPGIVITYSYRVTNSGNVTLNPVTVTDPMPGLSAISCPATSLAAGAQETCTATHTTTQADVNAGQIVNTGTATGTPPNGNPNVSDQDSTTVRALQAPDVTLSKSANPTSFTSVGTVITYSYLVTNTGNVTLNPVTVTDPMPGLSAISCPATSLAVGIAETCTATYATTQTDLDRGRINNTGTVTATPPLGSVLTRQSSATVLAAQRPAITLAKSPNIGDFSAVGTQ